MLLFDLTVLLPSDRINVLLLSGHSDWELIYHKYDFIQSLGFVNQLKVRASYGQIGGRISHVQARSTYDIVTDEWYKTGISTRLKAWV